MSGFILVNPAESCNIGKHMRFRYAKRVFGVADKEPIRVFLRKSLNCWDLLQNRDGWVADPSLYLKTPEQMVNHRYEDVKTRYYCRTGDYVVVTPTPVGNIVFVIEHTDLNLPFKQRTHNVAVAVPECLVPFLGHEFENIDEVLGIIHYRPKYNEDDSLYRQVEEIIYKEAVTKVTWLMVGILLFLSISSMGNA